MYRKIVKIILKLQDILYLKIKKKKKKKQNKTKKKKKNTSSCTKQIANVSPINDFTIKSQLP